LKKFFKAASTEERNVRVSVQEALFSMIDAYKTVVEDETSKGELEEILLDSIDKVSLILN
jgi:hypothetical protein